QSVKFHDLLQVAKDLGAEALATGHYVGRREADGRVSMRRGADLARDQSYFLFATTREQLSFLRFPLAGIPKPQVRDIARQLGLKIAMKPDSQDICFVPEGKYTTLIDKLRPAGHAKGSGREPGLIRHIDGRILGEHSGITGYTIGQRRGLNVAVGEPLFVVRLDPVAREVIVGPREALLTRRLRLKETNWLGEADFATAARQGMPVLARVRSTRPPVPARLVVADDGIEIEFDGAEEGVAPGQACVLYDPSDDGRVLGGGFIASTTAAVYLDPQT
ncbi:MAG: MnmA/TRMU family protein, partial [Asticcacaulis sp.]